MVTVKRELPDEDFFPPFDAPESEDLPPLPPALDWDKHEKQECIPCDMSEPSLRVFELTLIDYNFHASVRQSTLSSRF